MKKITLAYSPDTDDAFMVQPLLDGSVTHPKFDIEFISADIQELNVKAQDGVYDITAISIAAYPSIASQYIMVPVGASVGDSYGPAIVVRKDSAITSIEHLKGKTIGVPGKYTSAYFSSMSLLPEYSPKFMIFSDIENAVEKGDVDAGILIHELQIECETGGLRKIDDLGNLWAKKHDGLPLPLGTNAISRRFENETIGELVELYRKSIKYAFENRRETLKKAIDSANPGMDIDAGEKYIKMFVNERALDLDEPVIKGIRIMYDEAHKKGLCQKMREDEYLFTF